MTSPHMPPRRGREPKTKRHQNACHCGRPASPDRDRGMCTACDDSRCDAYPLECPYSEHTEGPRSDEQATSAHPDRPTSNEPSERVWAALGTKTNERRRLTNLAESHAHEADRLAHTPAGTTHALLAIAYALLGGDPGAERGNPRDSADLR